MQAPAERQGLERAAFERDVLPMAQPVVLRGLVAHWPAVGLAQRSPPGLLQLLAGLDSGQEVDALMLPPANHATAAGSGGGRRIYYNADGSGFNYLRNRLPLSRVAEQLLRYAHFAEPPAVAVQSAPVADCAPGLLAEHTMPLLDAAIAPRLWLGNRIVTPAHFDESHNIACVVAGQRRFTLFPPEQVANLYVGPLGHAPTATPISLVDVNAPDLRRFPRFADALAAASSALLEPGDAIYIPPLWWHHVESLMPINLLLNYWWTAPGMPASSFAALKQAMSVFGAMPPAQRRAWAAMFAHWVFDTEPDTHAHIPPTMRPGA